MKHFFLIALLVLTLSSFGSTSSPYPVALRAQAATHQIVVESINGGPHSKGACSATAIGPHALLTATHCTVASDTISVDGEDAYIDGTIGDGLDHTIFLLHGIEFKSYADVSANQALTQGQHFFMFGNPGDLSNMYREGYVSGYANKDRAALVRKMLEAFFGGPIDKKKGAAEYKKPLVILYDFNGYFGDSGSALFDETGKIVGVTSFIGMQNDDDGYGIKFMGGYEMRLTPAQLQEARGH